MDIGTLRGLGTLLVFVAFVGLVIWVYNGKRKKSFDEAANLPFADEPDEQAPKKPDEDVSRSKSE
ncbi:CcoQ/FixQ family Cbb3-type cytochrome c oxidase assembly chaperone [Stutzerimonas azotifigens]|uniref:CcoQ/FixQ family Cbb3-type cytochrome c oxidase assembly chaperone n=1 Tax=Stutzerimonas azotifigens TaxID=291995 RepID=UPI00040D6D46|nr:CcoQ/FixQ family Cbb3-type cytochrome c oxidase assembly chaperone [Stutzerimonas azotifigens]